MVHHIAMYHLYSYVWYEFSCNIKNYFIVYSYEPIYMHIFAAAILVSCNLIFLQGVHSVKLIFSGALHIYTNIHIVTT